MASRDYDNVILVDIIGAVIDSMRETDTITGSVETSPGIYVIDSKNGLKDFDYITIDDVDYQVSSVSDTNYTINSDPLLDFTGKTWKAKAPYYLHGHPLEIVNRLNKKNKGVYSYQKYPLIALFQDFEEPIGDDLALYATPSPTFIIANLTRPEITADDRYDRNFRDVLYPLYYDFLNKLYENRSFLLRDPRTINHTKIDRLYWGTSAGNNNERNIANDYLDAIELNNVELPVVENRCKY